MKKTNIYVIIFIIISMITLNYYRPYLLGTIDTWWHRWIILLVMCSIIYSIKLAKEYHITVAIVFNLVILSGIMVFGNKANELYLLLPNADKYQFRYYSAYGAFAFVIMICAMCELKNYMHVFKKIFAFLCILNALCVLSQLLLNALPFILDKKAGGFLGCPTINGTFTACTLPILLHEASKYFNKKVIIGLAIVVVLSIILEPSSVPVGCLTLSLGSYIFLNFPKGRGKILYCLSVPIFLLGISFVVHTFYKHINLFDSSDRFKMFELSFEYFLQRGNIFLGFGTATFSHLCQYIQGYYGFNEKMLMLWLHSDYLQILIEGGLFLAIMTLIMNVCLIVRVISDKKYWLAAAIFGYMGGMLFNYNLHIALTAFLGVYLVVEGFRKNDYKI